MPYDYMLDSDLVDDLWVIKLMESRNSIAIGAVIGDGTTYLNEELISIPNISSEYIDQVKSEQIEEIKRIISLHIITVIK